MLLQSPDAPEPPLVRPPFFVLRRYSQFRQLYLDVRLWVVVLLCCRAHAAERWMTLLH